MVFIIIIFVALPIFMDVQKLIAPSEGLSRPYMNPYIFYKGMDSEGNNIIKRGGLAGNIPRLKAACNTTPGCKGFNTQGWLKNNVELYERWSNLMPGSNKGFYVRNGPGTRVEDAAMVGSSL